MRNAECEHPKEEMERTVETLEEDSLLPFGCVHQLLVAQRS